MNKAKDGTHPTKEHTFLVKTSRSIDEFWERFFPEETRKRMYDPEELSTLAETAAKQVVQQSAFATRS